MKIKRTVISAILIISLVFGTFACMGMSAAAANVLGDANSDGAINSFDALVIIRHASGEALLDATQAVAADVDGDSKITSLDALYVLHYTIGKGNGFPAGGENQRVPIFGGAFHYDPATGQVTNEDGSGLLGFSYDANEGVFYASNNAWQRTFGYTHIYDYAAPLIICNFDTSRIFFEYDNKEWMVQLWKGQYGFVLIGCEIGLYYRDFNDDTLVDDKGRKFYKCADDDMLVKMSLNFWNNGKLVFNREEQYSWWLTGFKPGALLPTFGVSPDETARLRVDTRIHFADAAMMDAFIVGLKNTTEIEHNASKRIRKVTYTDSNIIVDRNNQTVAFNWQ